MDDSFIAYSGGAPTVKRNQVSMHQYSLSGCRISACPSECLNYCYAIFYNYETLYNNKYTYQNYINLLCIHGFLENYSTQSVIFLAIERL